jgi:hypothetical protein
MAVVLGGWDPDTAKADMLGLAQNFVRDLRLDLDAEDAFVPGVRRGLAIIPNAPRPGESAEDRRTRVQAAITQVRNANVVPPGRTRAAWMTYSRTQAERKRAALAGKAKRLILLLGAQAGGDEEDSRPPWRSSGALGRCGLRERGLRARVRRPHRTPLHCAPGAGLTLRPSRRSSVSPRTG